MVRGVQVFKVPMVGYWRVFSYFFGRLRHWGKVSERCSEEATSLLRYNQRWKFAPRSSVSFQNKINSKNHIKKMILEKYMKSKDTNKYIGMSSANFTFHEFSSLLLLAVGHVPLFAGLWPRRINGNSVRLNGGIPFCVCYLSCSCRSVFSSKILSKKANSIFGHF